MQFSSKQRLWWLFLGAMADSSATYADALTAVQLLRGDGCGGKVPATAPLHRSALLDQAARDWATDGVERGLSPSAAADRNGYHAEITAGLHINGPDSAAMSLLRRSSCRTISDQSLHDVGVYQRGADTWLLLATAYAQPSSAEAPALSARVLDLVNAARASGARCGERSFAPAPRLTLSSTLTAVALGHARDMAQFGYFDHQDLAGHTPADRVRAVGYREKVVGENIAYGPQSAEEVVRGWMDSPGHCENIMDPRFEQMGVAFAVGHASKRGLYWVQLLVEPRT